MSDVFGVVPTGFARKGIDYILADYEEAARTIFGQTVLLDPETPMGQLLGLMALLASQNWEIAEDTYQSVDPDQGEGPRLDQLGKIRGVVRPSGEVDAVYRRRITNFSRSDIHLRFLISAVNAVEGVRYVRVWENATDVPDINGIAGHSLAVAVLGGLSPVVAEAIYLETVAGIGLHGNIEVPIEVSGYCRLIRYLELTEVPVTIEIDARARTFQGCVAPDQETILAQIERVLGYDADFGLVNGEDVTQRRIIGAVEQLPGIEVVEVRIARDDDLPGPVDLVIDFDEIASIVSLSVDYLE